MPLMFFSIFPLPAFELRELCEGGRDTRGEEYSIQVGEEAINSERMELSVFLVSVCLFDLRWEGDGDGGFQPLRVKPRP